MKTKKLLSYLIVVITFIASFFIMHFISLYLLVTINEPPTDTVFVGDVFFALFCTAGMAVILFVDLDNIK